jgi:hypothetical protein
MKKEKLLPPIYHSVGWVLLLLFVPLGIATMFWEFNWEWLEFTIRSTKENSFLESSEENFTNELAALGALLGFVLITFSALKKEDEWTTYLRLQSWKVSMIIYAIVAAIQVLLFYGFNFVYALSFNMYLPFLFYYIWFRSKWWIAQKQLRHEEFA